MHRAQSINTVFVTDPHGKTVQNRMEKKKRKKIGRKERNRKKRKK